MKNKIALVELMAPAVLLIAFCCFAMGCAVKGDDDDEDSDSGSTQQESVFNLSAVTNANGAATVSFTVAEGSTKFSIMAAVNGGDYVSFEVLENGENKNFLNPGGLEITMANTAFRYVNFASVPSRQADGTLTDNDRYTASVSVSDSTDGAPVEDASVTFTINSKDDSNLDTGPLRVNFFYVGDVGQEQTTRDVMASAIQEFSEIFSSAASISLNITEYYIDGPVVLPMPLYGDSFYSSASGSALSPAVNLFIGGDIDDLGSSGEVLGLAGGIPGPALPSERSGVAVSFFAGAGADGVYSAEDVRILGETLAHESAHFMGLFHPVEFSGGTVDATDPLDDTATCSFLTSCLSDQTLISNLMFPSPVSDGSGGYYPQNQLTSQQRGVLNRYIVVD